MFSRPGRRRPPGAPVPGRRGTAALITRSREHLADPRNMRIACMCMKLDAIAASPGVRASSLLPRPHLGDDRRELLGPPLQHLDARRKRMIALGWNHRALPRPHVQPGDGAPPIARAQRSVLALFDAVPPPSHARHHRLLPRQVDAEIGRAARACRERQIRQRSSSPASPGSSRSTISTTASLSKWKRLLGQLDPSGPP